LEIFAWSPTFWTDIRIRHARCSWSAAPAFRAAFGCALHLRLGPSLGFQTCFGDDANRRRLGLLDRIDERPSGYASVCYAT
jgi:hypothetical protein